MNYSPGKIISDHFPITWDRHNALLDAVGYSNSKDKLIISREIQELNRLFQAWETRRRQKTMYRLLLVGIALLTLGNLFLFYRIWGA